MYELILSTYIEFVKNVNRKDKRGKKPLTLQEKLVMFIGLFISFVAFGGLVTGVVGGINGDFNLQIIGTIAFLIGSFFFLVFTRYYYMSAIIKIEKDIVRRNLLLSGEALSKKREQLVNLKSFLETMELSNSLERTKEVFESMYSDELSARQEARTQKIIYTIIGAVFSLGLAALSAINFEIRWTLLTFKSTVLLFWIGASMVSPIYSKIGDRKKYLKRLISDIRDILDFEK